MSTYDDILNHTLGGWTGQQSEIDEHLDFIADIDLSEPDYSFHLLRIYVRKQDGMLLWATDSGCSCPSPFEDTKVSGLHESTLATLTDTALAAIADGEYASNPVAAIRRDITTALAEAKKRGAR